MRKKHLIAKLADVTAQRNDAEAKLAVAVKELRELERVNERQRIEKLQLGGRLSAAHSVNQDLRNQLEVEKLDRSTGPDRPNRKKLTEQEARDIRKAFRGGMKQKDLASNYGVNPATISRIVRGIYH